MYFLLVLRLGTKDQDSIGSISVRLFFLTCPFVLTSPFLVGVGRKRRRGGENRKGDTEGEEGKEGVSLLS